MPKNPTENNARYCFIYLSKGSREILMSLTTKHGAVCEGSMSCWPPAVPGVTPLPHGLPLPAELTRGTDSPSGLFSSRTWKQILLLEYKAYRASDVFRAQTNVVPISQRNISSSSEILNWLLVSDLMPEITTG